MCPGVWPGVGTMVTSLVRDVSLSAKTIAPRDSRGVDLGDHVGVVLQVLVVEVVVNLGNVVRGVGEGEPGGAVLLGYVPADVVYVQVSNGDYFDFVD